MKAYQDLVQHVIDFGTRKENRTGVDTLSTFNYNYELGFDPSIYSKPPVDGDHQYLLDPTEGEGYPFPLLTTKSVSWKNIVVEMLWFLSGQTDISILKRHGCKFWDAWADDQGKVPSAYGNFWRQFPVHGSSEKVSNVITRASQYTVFDGSAAWEDLHGTIQPELVKTNDQIKWVLAELRRNPMSRRMVVSAWAPGNAQTSKLPPCHCLYMFNVQNIELPKGTAYCLDCHHKFPAESMRCTGCSGVKITEGHYPALCLHLTQRSCDVALGVPYNIASYALLLCLFSHLSGIRPGIFAHTLVDAHIYTSKPDGSMAEYDHLPGLKEQLGRASRPLPRLTIDPSIRELEDVERLMAPEVTTEEILQKFRLEHYEPHPEIKFKVAV